MFDDIAPKKTPDEHVTSVSDSDAASGDSGVDPDRDPFEELASEFSERHRRGEMPSIEDYASAHPDLADEIRELFPTIAAMEQLKERKTPPPRPTLGGLPLEELGDFRILGEIGRGGMGVVYEAEQVSLGRHVAVKVLPKQALLDERHLRRFEREAQTAAKLHHTNIVPVFGVGQQDGYHYIVMQFIRGVGLDEVLIALRKIVVDQDSESFRNNSSSRASHANHNAKALLDGQFGKPIATGYSSSRARNVGSSSRLQPTSDATIAMLSTQAGPLSAEPTDEESHSTASVPPLNVDQSAKLACLGNEFYRSVARIGAQVADALAYAHDQGTLHRDIKPGNLLLDAAGTVWVADFGLAKLAEHDNVSRSGDIVGTLSYMPPESFSGEADARGDIYALGLTLYELLAMRPAYYGRDRGKLVREITAGELPRLGKLNASIPRDLETIVLKAIAHRPEDRYATATELAHDLECFLEDMPIKARRMSVPEQFARWCRKNKLVATLAASVLSLLVLTAGLATYTAKTQSDVATLEQQRADAETQLRKKAEEETVTAELARQDALQKALKTLGAFKRVFYKIDWPRLPLSADAVIQEASVVGLDEEQATSLAAVATEDEQLIAPPPINEQMASVLSGIVEEVNKLSEEFGNEGIFALTSADLTLQAGTFYFRLGQIEEAREALERATQKYQLIVDSQAHESPAAIVGLAMSLNELGNVKGSQFGRFGSHPYYEKAKELLRKHADELTDSSRAKYELARTLFLLEFNPIAEGRPNGPPRGGRSGRGRGPRGERPGGPGPPREPDAAPGRPTGPNADRGGPGRRPPEARDPSSWPGRRNGEQNLREAISLLETLVEKEPVAEYQYLLARCHMELRSDAEGEGHSEAKRILEELVQAHPNEPEYQYELAMALAKDVPSPFFRGPNSPPPSYTEDHLASLTRAAAVFESLSKGQPKVVNYAKQNAVTKMRLAELVNELAKQGVFSGEPSECQIAADMARQDYFRRFPTQASRDLILFIGSAFRPPSNSDATKEKLAVLTKIVGELERIAQDTADSLPTRLDLARIRMIMAFHLRDADKQLSKEHFAASRAMLERLMKELEDPAREPDERLRRETIRTMMQLLFWSGDGDGAKELRERFPNEFRGFGRPSRGDGNRGRGD
jgi:serine/threonine protein kinase